MTVNPTRDWIREKRPPESLYNRKLCTMNMICVCPVDMPANVSMHLEGLQKVKRSRASATVRIDLLCMGQRRQAGLEAHRLYRMMVLQ